MTLGTRTLRHLQALLVLAGASGGTAFAMDAALNASQLRQAIRAGTSMVSPTNGYIAGSYVLHEYTNGIRIDPTSPLVDALTIGTPYERVRYYSYLEGFQKKPVVQANARKVARENANRLTIITFTHSPDSVEAELEAWQQTYVKHGADKPVQRTYLDDFKPAILTLNGKSVTSTINIQGPFQDSFSVKGNPDFRYIGVIYFQFDLSAFVKAGRVTGMAQLQFKDPKGRNYTQQIDLSRYR